MKINLLIVALSATVVLLDAMGAEQTMRVTASAYNSTIAQTDRYPNIGAWGDLIVPGMQVVAVSPDLLDAGLTKGVELQIDELPGTWTVLDRMPSRYRQRIDIYMGTDVDAAIKWGVPKVTIRWSTATSSPSSLPESAPLVTPDTSNGLENY
jgi:3D (Asp-Asp-Asp) domain-containing protein